MVNNNNEDFEEDFTEEERRALRKKIEEERISEVTVTELDSRGRVVHPPKVNFVRPRFKPSELQSLRKEIRSLRRSRFRSRAPRFPGRSQVRSLAPIFPSFLGAGLSNANSDAINAQGGPRQVKFIDTFPDDPMVPRITLPRFDKPDFRMRQPKRRVDVVRTSNGIAPIFDAPKFIAPTFSMPDFTPSPIISSPGGILSPLIKRRSQMPKRRKAVKRRRKRR